MLARQQTPVLDSRIYNDSLLVTMKYWWLHRLFILKKAIRAFALSAQKSTSPLDQETEPLELQRKVYQKLSSISPSLCLAKWMQMTLYLQNGTNMSCHHVKSHKIDPQPLKQQPDKLHNTDFKMKMRKKMIHGQRPSECSYCWDFEDQGRISDRIHKSATHWALPFFDEVVAKKHTQSINPAHLEVSFENTCNLKCMYCGPSFSTTWIKESKDFGPYPTSDQHGSLKDVQRLQHYHPHDANNPYMLAFWKWWPELSQTLLNFRITGGEPLMSQHTWSVIEHFKTNPNTRLRLEINSNLSLPSHTIDKFITQLNALESKVKSFTLYTSVDSVGPQAEYIRYGLNYDQFMEHIHRVLQNVLWPMELSFMITVNALSLPKLKHLISEVHAIRAAYPNHKISFDTPLLKNPKHMAIDILPKQFDQYILDTLKMMMSLNTSPHKFNETELQKIDRLLTLFRQSRLSPTELHLRHRDFYKMFQEYDKRKNLNFVDTFPEYQEFWELCRQKI